MTVSAFSKKDQFITTEEVQINETTDVPSGSTLDIFLTADDGEIWEIIGYRIDITNPDGSSGGTHSIHASPHNATGANSAFFKVESSYDDDIFMEPNRMRSGSFVDTDLSESEQLLYINDTRILVDENFGFGFRYTNNTDVEQTNQIDIRPTVLRWEA